MINPENYINASYKKFRLVTNVGRNFVMESVNYLNMSKTRFALKIYFS